MKIRPDLAQIPQYKPGKPAAATAIKLSSNETTQPPLPSAIKAMQEQATLAHRYPDMAALDLRHEIGKYLGLSPSYITVGAGSAALCQQLVTATCTATSEVIFPWRSFEAYPIFVQVAGAISRPIALNNNGGHDLPAMAAAINPQTSLIFLCNPNNPTGKVFTAAEFTDFMQQVPADIIVALDEAYIEYNRNPELPDAVTELHKYPNLVVLRTFSKAYSLAGARLGYALAAPEIINAINAVGVPFQANRMAQAGAIASLQAREELQERLDITVSQRERAAKALGADSSETNFIWLPTPANDPDFPTRLAADFAAQGIIVRAFPEGLRITITDSAETDALLGAWETINAKHS
ncbi:histidinol-phosphate transaminase [Corynebacterium caspium]|uniref:histidinol-phosphate transaminase n=1 Tax=Corynebacterium caspium TaxID=234828 RepID=UPI0003797A9C|nr:histidinol-phosphate transaminase [Corynebacterium caspium]WKD58521.1 Putative phenylalanine aminotransferase [Corynebacterium caspium DSM 44850]